MKARRLTNKKIALENIRRKPVRSFGLIILVGLFTMALLMGTLVSISLTRGVKSLSNRLGADVIVVPEGYRGNVEGILLTGEPSDVYLPTDTIDKLKDIPGVDIVSPQLYIATLKASCCSYPVQIIGFDENTDFIIKPWMVKNYIKDLKDGEVILGSQITGEVDQEIKFFGNDLKINARLEKTGMGFDTSVFMNLNTAKKLAKDAERIKKHPVVENKDQISVVMVRTKPTFDSKSVAASITKKLRSDGIYAMYSKNFVNQVSSNLIILSGYIKVTILLLWIVAIIIIATVFSIIVNERKKEMNILRVIGATKMRLLLLILDESLILSVIGSVLGVVVGGLVTAIMLPQISETLKVPFLLPEIYELIMYVAFCIIIGCLTGPLSSLYSGIKVAKRDAYTSTRGM